MPQTKTKRKPAAKRRKPPTKRRPGAEERADRAAEARMWRESDDAQRARYLETPLPYTIHDSYLCPNNRKWIGDRTLFPDEWSASVRRVAEAALLGHLRIAVPCPLRYVAQMSALIARTLRGVANLSCGYDQANEHIIVWNMSEEDDANDVEMLLP